MIQSEKDFKEVIKAKRSFQEHCKRVWAKYSLPEEIRIDAHDHAHWRTCLDLSKSVKAEDLDKVVVYSAAKIIYEDHYMNYYNKFKRKT